MLPSMPVLFSRDSLDAFGNKIEPSTSYFNLSTGSKPIIINPEPQPVESKQEDSKPSDEKQSNVKKSTNIKKKEELNVEDNALETALVRSYYTKVQSRFSSNASGGNNKFVQFQNVLKSFDPIKETPVDLYRKVEEIFGKEHKDIVEEFLLFLRPGQAAEVGRFMDRYMLVQMTNFIEMLHTCFARKPIVLRKILRALTTGLNNGNSEDTKARVLPHLRSNPRLAQMFKSLFPDERPPDSWYESGVDTIHEGFLTADKGFDVWELDAEGDDKRKLEAKEHLDTMYLHGRVFLQHGRLLRSARVSFPYSKEPYRVHARRLAPAHHTLPDSDEDKPKNKPPKRTRKQLKSPTKTAKDVNDNTKVKECVMSPKAKKVQAKIKKKEDKIEKVKETGQKRDRKDSKSHDGKKKDAAGPKAKLTKIAVDSDATDATRVVDDVLEAKKVDKQTENNNLIIKRVNGKFDKFAVLLARTEEEERVQPNPTETKVDTTLSNFILDAKNADNFDKRANKEPKKIDTYGANGIVTSKVGCLVSNTSLEITVEDGCKSRLEEKQDDLKSNNWTRDEDKTMLQILKGEAASDKVFGRIRELLPHRTSSEIKERFCHVMTLLQQMAVGEVT